MNDLWTADLSQCVDCYVNQTLNELKRCFHELTRVQVTRLTLEELEAADELYLASLIPRKPLVPKQPAPPKKIVPPKPQIDPAELRLQDRWERLVDMIQKGRLSALQDFIAKHHEEADPDWTGLLPPFLVEKTNCASVLHLAAMADQVELVEWLLVDRRCDPTTLLSYQEGRPRTLGMTAYEVAGSRGTRNVFRRAMANHPDWYDWLGAARVPSGLSEEMEAQQASKAKDRKQRFKEKLKERDKGREEAEERERVENEERERRKKLKEEEEAARKGIKRLLGPQRLGGSSKAGDVSKPLEPLGLTPEQRMRLERERRARAAEARLKS